MKNIRRVHPICPKCKSEDTYDILPEITNTSHFEENDGITRENSTFYCMNCEYSWKKYEDNKIYDNIKMLYVNSGGFPGPYFEVVIDFERYTIEQHTSNLYEYVNEEPTCTDEKALIEWFRKELRKCDLVNWAEEYFAPVLDGTHWSVRIEYDNYCEIKRGSNHFPQKWNKFCKAVSKVSGSEFY